MRLRISFFMMLVLLASAATRSQEPRLSLPGQPQQAPDEQQARMEREQAKQLNQERHEALRRDTDKLVKLSNELKQYVDKSNENVMSLDVIKKAGEIEKLAHSVKEKMKGT